MKSPFESRQYAEVCRSLANGVSLEHRREVLRMADIWEDLTGDRERIAMNEFADVSERGGWWRH